MLKKRVKIIEEGDNKTPVKFSDNKKGDRFSFRKIRKKVFLFLALFLLAAISYFGYRAYDSIEKIFAGESGLLNFIGGSQGKLLDGELDGRVNVLLLGIGGEGHTAPNLADTIILASYDTNTKSVAMVSIPRDTYVKIPAGWYTKINAAHAYGEEDNEGQGPEAMKEVVEELTGQKIHYYARIDFTGLKEIVDYLGGVTVDVERSFCDYNYDRRAKTDPVCFEAGKQTLNGERALEYARSRKAAGPEGSDFARSKRQQKIILAIKEKAFSLETAFNPKKVLSILSSLGKHVKTDFQIDELARVYELSKDIDTSMIINKNLDPTTNLVRATSNEAGYVLVPTAGIGNYDDIHKFFANIFNGVEIKKENAKVAFLNGTWSTWYYTKLYDEMESEGINLVKDGGTAQRGVLTTQIIDYTNGQKPKTIEYLENKLGVKAITKMPPEGADYEIEIILGSDYRS